MKQLCLLCILYAAAWLIAANDDFVGSDEIVAYQLLKLSDAKPNLPNELTMTPTRYRIGDDFVVVITGRYGPKKHSKCDIFNVENWRCTFDDESGYVGFREGVYFIRLGTPYLETRTVSRFDYVKNLIAWMAISDQFLHKAMILFIPFLL